MLVVWLPASDSSGASSRAARNIFIVLLYARPQRPNAAANAENKLLVAATAVLLPVLVGTVLPS